MTDDDELQYLVNHYRPNNDVLSKLAGVRVLAVIGPSAVGKTTIMELAQKKSPLLRMIGNNTSRQQRSGEQPGAEFTFMTKEQMVEGIKRGSFVQVAMMPSGDLYGTRLHDYFQDRIGILGVQAGVIPVFQRLFPDLKMAFIVPASYEIWMQWFEQRQDSDENKVKRLEEAKTSLEFALATPSLHFILNDELEEAADRLIQVAENAKPDSEDRAKELAVQQLAKLSQSA